MTDAAKPKHGERHDDKRANQTPHPEPAPARPGGVASGLQPGGTTPGRSPAASMGSVGTGGGSTGRTATGNVARRERDGET